MLKSVTALVLGAALLAGCSDAHEADVEVVPPTAPADGLAPSQVTAETVPRPNTPPPCRPDDIAVLSSEIAPGAAPATMVLSLHNEGGSRCEVDIRESTSVDPLMEPDVWLDPGGWAEVVIDLRDGTCGESDRAGTIPIDVNGTTRLVPLGEIVVCDWTLNAFYPVDEPAG
jgi:hypothetical protein